MSGRRTVWGSFIVMVLALSACSNSPETTTSQQAAPTSSTTTTSPSTTTTTSSTTTTPPTTTTTVSGETVGDPAALAALVTQINTDFIGYEGEIPIPDLTNPDPLVGLEEIERFEIWTATNVISTEWYGIHFCPASPALEESQNVALNFQANNWILQTTESYQFLNPTLISLSDPAVARDIADGAPAGARAIIFEDILPSFDLLDLDDGSIVQTFPATAPTLRVAVVVPTEHGWQLYYESKVEE